MGKWCIHPSQIAIANEVFSPTDREIERAKAIVAAVRKAESEGLGAANYEGIMIDAATTRNFELVLERAQRMGRA